MKNRIEQVINTNFDVIDTFFKQAKEVIYNSKSKKEQIKKLYAVYHSLHYFISINNAIIKEYLQEKHQKQP
jgi:predicted metallopeptidase